MRSRGFSRRQFLGRSALLAAGAPLATRFGALAASVTGGGQLSVTARNAKVAIVQCRSYGAEVRPALDKCFDLLGGIGSLVKDKTVTVKLNLTGTDFRPFLDRPVGETFMTHFDTALALGSALFQQGAKRVRFVESTQSVATLRSTLSLADWDVK